MSHINLNEVAAEIADEKGPNTSVSRKRPPSHIRRKNKGKNATVSRDHEELESLLSEPAPVEQPQKDNNVTETIDAPVESDIQDSTILQTETVVEVAEPAAEAVVEEQAQVTETEAPAVEATQEQSAEEPKKPVDPAMEEALKAFSEMLKDEVESNVKFNTGEDVLSFIGQPTWKSVYKNLKTLFINDEVPEGIMFNFMDNLKDASRGDYLRSHTLKTLMSVLASKLKNVNLRKDNKVYFFEVIDFIGKGYCEFIIDYSKDEPTVCIGWSDEYRHIKAFTNNGVVRYDDVSIDFLLQAMDFALRQQMQDLIELTFRK